MSSSLEPERLVQKRMGLVYRIGRLGYINDVAQIAGVTDIEVCSVYVATEG